MSARLHPGGHTLLPIALGVVLAGAALGARSAPPATERVVVEVATVSVRPVTAASWIPGSIVSRADARIASVIAARVTWIAEVGTQVRQGEPLARLDDTMSRLRLEDLRAQVARARAQHEVASSQLERFNRLAATQALSVSQLDDAKAQRDVSGDDVARADAQLREAQYEIDQSVIRAPFPGIVTERFIQRGEFVQVGAATVRLVNISDVEARATAALDLAANVRPGQTVSVRDHGSEKRGTVRTVVPVGDDRSRQFEVRVALSDSAALVGTPVEVSLPATSRAHRRHRAAGCARHPPEPFLCAARHPRQHRRAARCDPGARHGRLRRGARAARPRR